MKILLKLLPLIVLGAASLNSQVISMNYNEGVTTGDSAIDGTESWGIVPSSSWTNGSYFTGNIASSGVNVATFGGAGTTASYTASVSVNNTGWHGGIRNFPATTNLARFDLTNIQQWLDAEGGTSYDIYVYITGFNADTYTPMTATTGGVSLPTYYVNIDAAGDFAAQFQNYTQITSTNSASPTDYGNYVLYQGLTADTFNFTLGQPVDGGQTAIGGWQLVTTPVPEPSTYALLAGMATLGFVIVRRRMR